MVIEAEDENPPALAIDGVAHGCSAIAERLVEAMRLYLVGATPESDTAGSRSRARAEQSSAEARPIPARLAPVAAAKRESSDSPSSPMTRPNVFGVRDSDADGLAIWLGDEDLASAARLGEVSEAIWRAPAFGATPGVGPRSNSAATAAASSSVADRVRTFEATYLGQKPRRPYGLLADSAEELDLSPLP
jgi:hypothetical protein